MELMKKPKKHYLLRRYRFLYEIIAKVFSSPKKIDLVHIMYGEEYYRLSNILFKSVPIVVTFHQPPQILENEITKGNHSGRVMGILHKMNKNRFRKISAAIVVNENQKPILSKVMPKSKIHVLPLGLNFNYLNNFRNENKIKRQNIILTVGNWQRDWNFYFEFVKEMQIQKPEFQFILINRVLPERYLIKIKNYKNLKYFFNASTEQLYTYYLKSKVQFLPFLGSTANNSINESIALGCPILTNVNITNFGNSNFYFKVKLNQQNVKDCIEKIFQIGEEEFKKISLSANEKSKKFDWEIIAHETKNIYKSILN